MFKGSLVALVTPMQTDGSIDFTSLDELIEWHIASKTAALVVAGTTGEGATLTPEEHSLLLSHVVKYTARRLPIIAGTGSYCTQHALELTTKAKDIGVDAALIVTPYYLKPTQNGLYEHYKFISDRSKLPIILYNVPSRTACDLLPDTIERLAKLPTIVGIKEATGKVERTREIIQRCPSLAVYSGDDASNCELLLNGARGVISVTANVVPQSMAVFCETALAHQVALAEQLHAELTSLHKLLFAEANPIPVKWALHDLGRIPPGIRLPLTLLDKKYHAELRKVLSNWQ